MCISLTEKKIMNCRRVTLSLFSTQVQLFRLRNRKQNLRSKKQHIVLHGPNPPIFLQFPSRYVRQFVQICFPTKRQTGKEIPNRSNKSFLLAVGIFSRTRKIVRIGNKEAVLFVKQVP